MSVKSSGKSVFEECRVIRILFKSYCYSNYFNNFAQIPNYFFDTLTQQPLNLTHTASLTWKKFTNVEVQGYIFVSNYIDFTNAWFWTLFCYQKNMYNAIYTIRNFREYSIKSSKMTVLLVKSRHQFKFHLLGCDVKRSSSCRKLTFKKKQIYFRIQCNPQYYLVVVFYLLLNSVATIDAACAHYSTSLANWNCYFFKIKS